MVQKTTTFQFVQIGAKQKTGNGTNNKKKSWKKWAFFNGFDKQTFSDPHFFLSIRSHSNIDYVQLFNNTMMNVGSKHYDSVKGQK